MAMPHALQDAVYTLGGALVAPGLGHAELILAVVVALAFAGSALRTCFDRVTRERRRLQPATE
jgi:hypothetical protein